MDLISLLDGSGYCRNGLREESGIKLLRHTRSDNLVVEQRLKYDQSYLEAYQAHQGTDLFRGCQTILSFVGDHGRRAIFRGAWTVNNKISREDYCQQYLWGKDVLADDVPKEPYLNESWYSTASIDLLGDLVNRLVIDWGRGLIRWDQWLSNREVVEILPKNYVGEFSGYENLILTYHELQTIISDSVGNRVWHQHLSSVAAVYLILDRKTGTQYVGSAYGNQGLWGRWAEYAANPSGGDRLLEELLTKYGQQHSENFQFSVLRVLQRRTPADHVIQYEQIEKLKLGTRAFGLNVN